MNRYLSWVFRALVVISCFPIQIAVGIPYKQPTGVGSPTNNRSELFSKTSPTYLAQLNPVYGCWRLTYSVSGIVYESLLKMDGYDGVMLTAYFDPNIRDTNYVQQTMRLRSSARGLLILGYNPVYPGTNRRHSTYNADNFLFQIRPNGNYLFATCDDAAQCSPVEVGPCPRS